MLKRFVIQVLDPHPTRDAPGWQDVAVIWDSEVGLCFAASDQPDARESLEEARAVAQSLAEDAGVTAAVFDRESGARVFQTPP